MLPGSLTETHTLGLLLLLLLQEYPSQLATLAQSKYSVNQGEGTKAHQRAQQC